MLTAQEMSVAATKVERQEASKAAQQRFEKLALGVAGFTVFNLVGFGLYNILLL
mgnify:FL=1